MTISEGNSTWNNFLEEIEKLFEQKRNHLRFFCIAIQVLGL
jgi:hypothetical protein